MNQFKFRFSNIVALRLRDRDAAAGSYRQALAAREKLEQHIADLQAEYAELQPSRRLGVVDTQRMLEAGRYQMHLAQEVTQLAAQLQQIELECERRRSKLLESEQSLRVLEKLEEKQRVAWRETQVAREQSAVDEHASFRYWQANKDAAKK